MTYNHLAEFIMKELPEELRYKTVEGFIQSEEFGYEMEGGSIDSISIKYTAVHGIMGSPSVVMEFKQ
mgnify:CR=1 FL=1|jgi:hypothetical protein